LKDILSRIWNFKWLIAAASIVAASVTFALSRSDPGQIWTGKTNLTIGTAPTKSYLFQEAGSAHDPLRNQGR
jgi:hypothetical protein